MAAAQQAAACSSLLRLQLRLLQPWQPTGRGRSGGNAGARMHASLHCRCAQLPRRGRPCSARRRSTCCASVKPPAVRSMHRACNATASAAVLPRCVAARPNHVTVTVAASPAAPCSAAYSAPRLLCAAEYLWGHVAALVVEETGEVRPAVHPCSAERRHQCGASA